ncbi:CBO0543 family protein [Neobacillus drentensis]|uniref:CBO0543 family protein n=1 Tax=Neobacillus drentensis TaxID=220684 RepID=UPI003B585F7C
MILLIFACIYADWKNWRIYYPTIVFTVCIDFFITILTYEHSLWYFHKAFLAPNHTVADFFIAFTNYPLIVLVFLSLYPYKAQIWRKLAYIFIWSSLFTVIETIFLFLKLLSYHHVWTFWWSYVVWIFIFMAIIIHQKTPLFAWLLCFSCTIFLILYFHIPVLKMK